MQGQGLRGSYTAITWINDLRTARAALRARRMLRFAGAVVCSSAHALKPWSNALRQGATLQAPQAPPSTSKSAWLPVRLHVFMCCALTPAGA